MTDRRHISPAAQKRRRAAEERYTDALGPALLDIGYAQYLLEGRGVIYIPAHNQAVDRSRRPMYVQAAHALEQFHGEPWFAPALETYDPQTEVILVFGYAESVYVRQRHLVDPTTGERLRGLDPAVLGPE